MSKGGVKIELKGMDDLLKAFKQVPGDLEPSVIRAVARKVGNKIVTRARRLFTRKDTGASRKSISILNVKDRRQRYIEVGVKGRSLAYIWMFWKGKERHKSSGASTGSIDPLGNVVVEAADQLGSEGNKEIQVSLNNIIKRAFRKYGLR